MEAVEVTNTLGVFWVDFAGVPSFSAPLSFPIGFRSILSLITILFEQDRAACSDGGDGSASEDTSGDSSVLYLFERVSKNSSSS